MSVDIRGLSRRRPSLDRWKGRATATTTTTLLRVLVGRTERAIVEAAQTPPDGEPPRALCVEHGSSGLTLPPGQATVKRATVQRILTKP